MGRISSSPLCWSPRLFLLWGFCNGMIDILNKHFQDSLHINKEQSGLVQFANYLAYFLMAIPAGLIARKFGYKGGILVGLVLIASGAFWFIHAVSMGTYWAFLLGLFIIAAGMTCLETIANPYTTVLGAPEHGATRINIAQTFNGVGWILGPIVGGHFVFSGKDGANANAGLSTPYLGIGIFAAVCWFSFLFLRRCRICMPKMKAKNPPTKRSASNLPAASWRASASRWLIVWGLLYFFIAPILGLVWALLNLPANLLDPTKYGLIVVAYIGSFIVVAKNWDMFRRKHFTLGVVTQFLYVAAQTGIFSFCVNYILENDPDVTPAKAATMLGAIGFVLFTAGRFCGSAVISQFKPQPRARGLRGHQCGAGGGVHGRRQAGHVCDVRHVLLHVRHVPDDFRARHPRVGRIHQARLVAHRDVHRGRRNCAAVHGPHRRCSFDARWHGGAAGLLRVHCHLRNDMADAGGQGRSEIVQPTVRPYLVLFPDLKI